VIVEALADAKESARWTPPALLGLLWDLWPGLMAGVPFSREARLPCDLRDMEAYVALLNGDAALGSDGIRAVFGDRERFAWVHTPLPHFFASAKNTEKIRMGAQEMRRKPRG
jgi:hypothetical protein